jgi:hypothetical protein
MNLKKNIFRKIRIHNPKTTQKTKFFPIEYNIWDNLSDQ